MVRDESKRMRRRLASRAGFTLVEILVALVVMGVAMTLIIWFLSASVDLNKENRRERIATSYAQEQLTELLSNPSAYAWALSADAKLGEVKSKDEKAPGLTAPSVLPSEKLPARKYEANFYDGFSWKAYSRLPAADAHYAEVVVVVTWRSTSGMQSGSERSITLTSSVPRSAVEGKA
ncbi:MAG: type II secretion system protein [Candidatus Hydrogenedentes bacterium]|nr:type II secretion system protein [Candidatus Hydrogenedentota bacterium]